MRPACSPTYKGTKVNLALMGAVHTPFDFMHPWLDLFLYLCKVKLDLDT